MTPAAIVNLQGRFIVMFSGSIVRKSVSLATESKLREGRGGKAGRASLPSQLEAFVAYYVSISKQFDESNEFTCSFNISTIACSSRLSGRV
jgi:hypothetical protein